MISIGPTYTCVKLVAPSLVGTLLRQFIVDKAVKILCSHRHHEININDVYGCSWFELLTVNLTKSHRSHVLLFYDVYSCKKSNKLLEK